MSIMIHVPKFKHKLGSAKAKAERLDWVISQLKKDRQCSAAIMNYLHLDVEYKKLSELNRLELEEFIQEHCRALRLSRLKVQEYTNQILFDIGLPNSTFKA